MKSIWIVGSSPECDIVVRHAVVSARHCQLNATDGALLLRDLGSKQGTFINGQRVVGAVAVKATDTITLGPTLTMPLPAEMQRLAKQAPGARWADSPTEPARPGEVILGRDPHCNLVLDGDRVSPRHARLRRSGSGLIIEDLHSTHGTFVNGQRIREPVSLAAGDVITVGRFKLEVTPEGRLKKRTSFGELTIEARNLSLEVPGRRLVENVSLTIYPSEFVGLMGPSGAGKTTLMNMLNGYSAPTEGQVLYNGQDLYANYAQFNGVMGYVPQDDIMHRELTVGQALRYTAQLRMPPGTTSEQIEARVTEVLQRLQLQDAVNTRIGSSERKGISGGQRKRVNLAMELLTNPAVLFLDEPTSGLSSEDALSVLKLLRELADSGKTILLTIHQPSLEAYRLLDNLVIVSRDAGNADAGRMVYYGPAYPDAIKFFNPQRDAGGSAGVEPSPDEVLRGLSSRPTQQWSERYATSSYFREYVTARAGTVQSAPVPTLPPPDPMGQWLTLTLRSLAIKISDRWNTTILLAQAPIVTFLIILVFGEPARQQITGENWLQTTGATAVTLFLLGISALWFGCSNSVREIVGEWSIYQRERMVNLQLPAYVLSKIVICGALCAIQCTILVVATRWGCGLVAPTLSSFLILMLTACVGVVLGLVISAFARTQEVAIALLPLVLIPMVIFGGTLLPVYKMQTVIRPLAYLMPSRYSFEAMILEEANCKPLGPSPYSTSILTDHTVDDPDRPDLAELYFPRHGRLGITASAAALAVLFAFGVVGVHLILLYRDVH
jgi:ABC-type multidrug transport system ATPase subunit